MPIETAPGEECQFDWSDCCDFGGAVRAGRAALLRGDLVLVALATLVVRHLDRPGPHLRRTGRGSMRRSAVCPISAAPTAWARSGTRRADGSCCTPVLDFARLHGTAIVVCAGRRRQAKRQDRAAVPGPEGDLPRRARVLDPPASMAEINARAEAFLETRVHNRPHSTTGVAPGERLPVEAPMMAVLPRVRFDTAYVEVRRVHPVLPLVEWRGVSYSVPPDAARPARRVPAPKWARTACEIRLAGKRVAPPPGLPGRDRAVWDPDHRAAAAGDRPRSPTRRPAPCTSRVVGRHDRASRPATATTPSRRSTCPATTSTEPGRDA